MTKKYETTLVPVILEDIIINHKSELRSIIEKESKGPVEHVKLFDKYNQLLSKQAEEEVELFLKEEHTFTEYEKEVRKFKKLAEEIQYKTEKIARVGMFELHCDELIRALAKRAESCQNKLLDRMMKDHFDTNKQ